MFNAFDLTLESLTVYETLIERSPSSVEDLQAGLLLPMPQLHQTLDLLEIKGLVSRIPGSPARYGAIPPEIALEVLLLQREEEIKHARRYAEELSSRFQHAAAGRDPAELVEIITGVPALRQRWDQLQRGSKHEVRGIDKPPYTVTAKSKTTSLTEREMLKKGIKYRIIYDTSGMEVFDDWLVDVETGITHGEQARIMNDAPTKMVIFDDRFALIPLQVAPSDATAMVLVHRSGLLEALCALFENLWRQALPFSTAAAEGQLSTPDRPTADETRLLGLLVTGAQDEVIAKHLGLSYRTLQRRLRDLMNRLGVETRFQAGLRASQLGWL